VYSSLSPFPPQLSRRRADISRIAPIIENEGNLESLSMGDVAFIALKEFSVDK
jgi:hypothetical protein